MPRCTSDNCLSLHAITLSPRVVSLRTPRRDDVGLDPSSHRAPGTRHRESPWQASREDRRVSLCGRGALVAPPHRVVVAPAHPRSDKWRVCEKTGCRSPMPRCISDNCLLLHAIIVSPCVVSLRTPRRDDVGSGPSSHRAPGTRQRESPWRASPGDRGVSPCGRGALVAPPTRVVVAPTHPTPGAPVTLEAEETTPAPPQATFCDLPRPSCVLAWVELQQNVLGP